MSIELWMLPAENVRAFSILPEVSRVLGYLYLVVRGPVVKYATPMKNRNA
jgi:hypothetical protein